MAHILIYSGPDCPYCDRAKMLLRKKGVTFEEINVRVDASQRDEMVKRSKGRQTIPQIFINENHVGGCDDLYALEAAGKLDELLRA